MSPVARLARTAARCAVALLVLAPAALAVEPEAPAGASAATAAKSPLEKLLEDRKYQDVILAVEDLRAKSGGKGVADADSEFLAAQAQARLKLYDAARERFQLVVKTYPTHARAGEAAVESAVTLLRRLEDQDAASKDKKLALQASKEAEAAARQFAADPKIADRAWYVAGNAARLGGDDPSAIRCYEQSRAQPVAEGEYPQKSTYMLAIMAAREFRTADARKLFTDCTTKWPSASTFDRCQKGLHRLDIVGAPAPKFSVETWLNSGPVEVESLRGNVVLVWFWQTWCPHCKDTMPEIAGQIERLKGKPFKVIGLTNSTRGQTTEIAKSFVSDPHWQISYPCAVDLDGRTSEAYATGGSAPAAILVDKKGIVRWADHPVYMTSAMIDKLLAE